METLLLVPEALQKQKLQTCLSKFSACVCGVTVCVQELGMCEDSEMELAGKPGSQIKQTKKTKP